MYMGGYNVLTCSSSGSDGLALGVQSSGVETLSSASQGIFEVGTWIEKTKRAILSTSYDVMAKMK